MSDREIRLAAFDWLARQAELHGEPLPWALLDHLGTFQRAEFAVSSIHLSARP